MYKQEVRILIAEDIPGESLLIEEELKKSELSFVAQCVTNQDSFFNALQHFCPEVVISCDTNPRLRGTWVISETKKWNAEVPVVIVSDLYEQAQVIKYFDAGAADFLSYDQLTFLPLVVRRLFEEDKESMPLAHADKQSPGPCESCM